ncbi:hypothetical protein BST81_06600 [Leptolyngbya sp. 'hensonii']|uniref:CRISPR-associated protein Csx18 n=1 Tax=Leptolyngbya sp. 'hensonii' TaxID=1922337 RepID=UPI00095010A3|nr:CRISPR-associated protein Csx18 [Leptolyngbya sp. 'hensonii']OLP19165.1 hypothetical protein BST81_06600 [Leptolyngbya sp. 'hensonii']
MSDPLARQVIRYRTWVVALANAGITWVILIIAPLGLFAVITCTALVFLSSWLVGSLCDRALLALMNVESWDAFLSNTRRSDLGTSEQRSVNPQVLPTDQRRNLPD